MKDIFQGIRGIKVLKREPLRKYTSFRIGGKALYLVNVLSQKALIDTMKVVRKYRLRYLVIGKGTNILFRNGEFDGVIIRLMGDFKKIRNNRDVFVSGAGALIGEFLITAARLDYGGAEFLAGSPGSIVGAVKGNAGAFGHSISEIVKYVTLFEPNNKIRAVTSDQIIFDYRYSNICDRAIIMEVAFKLREKPRRKIEKQINEYLEIRWKKQPRGFSAGSIFKNPLPLSAGQLIEECGLKGMRVGDAVVSRKHANFILNLGQAKAQDVLRLMRIIRRRVRDIKGIDLEPEVRIV